MGRKKERESVDLGWKTFIHERISKAEKEQSSSQRNARKTGPQKDVTPIRKGETYDSSI